MPAEIYTPTDTIPDLPIGDPVTPEEKPKYGIKETAEGVKFACAIASVIATMDEVPWTANASKLFPLIETGVAAIAGADQIPAEISDLDDSEIAKLIAVVRANFDLPNDELEAAIEDSVALVAAAYSLATRFKKAVAIGEIKNAAKAGQAVPLKYATAFPKLVKQLAPNDPSLKK